MQARLFAVSLVLLFAAQGLPLADAQGSIAPPTTIPNPAPHPSPAFGYPGTPVFTHYPAPIAMPGADNAREPSVSVSWNSGNTMVKAGTHTYRVVFDDTVQPPAPRWTLVTPTMNIEENPTLYETDPFLYTDPDTGRTWAGSRVLPCPSMAFTDDDGQHWHPMPAPCTGGLGWDNVTWASAPYDGPAPSAYPKALYYCGHTYYGQRGTDQRPWFLDPPPPVDPYPPIHDNTPQDIGSALTCVVSLDGGETFLPNMAIGGAPPLGACTGRFGHVETDFQGWAYVPNPNCGGTPGFYWLDAAPTDLANPDTAFNLVEWKSATVDCGLAPMCGSLDHPPSISISKPASDLSESAGGVVWYAAAEQSGLYVAKAEWSAGNWVWNQTLGSTLAGTATVSIRPTTANQFVTCPTPPGMGAPYLNVASLGYDQACQVPMTARFPVIIAGDDKRAAVGFFGAAAQATPQQPATSCGVISDPFVWFHYVATTMDGGANWTVERTSGHPVHVGGIWEDSVYMPEMTFMLDPTQVVDPGQIPPCSNHGIWMDGSIDAQGRPVWAITDGCLPWAHASVPACNAGSAGDDSNHGWLTLVRQSTGCGLFASVDDPADYACTAQYPPGKACGGWDCRPWTDSPPPAIPWGDISIANPPVPPATYPHDGSFTFRGSVERPWVYNNLTLDTSPLQGIDISAVTAATIEAGVDTYFLANPVGGHAMWETSFAHNKYACHWTGSKYLIVDDDMRCIATSVRALTPGQHTLTFAAYDKYDVNRFVTKTIQVTAITVPQPLCPSPIVTDPLHDVNPYIYLGQQRAEGADVDVRRMCITPYAPGEKGSFTVLLQMEDLAHLVLPGGSGIDNRDNRYGVVFCTDHNGPVCYGAVSETNAAGDRIFTGGVVRAGMNTGNPADFFADNRMCPYPGLLDTSIPSGNSLDLPSDSVQFRFQREKMTITAAPGAGCTLVTGGLPLVDGSLIEKLRGGARKLSDLDISDETDLYTGQQLPYRFMPPTFDQIQTNVYGVYETIKGEPVSVTPVLHGVTGPVKCQWVIPAKEWANVVYLTGEKSGSFLQPAGGKSCNGVQVVFPKPGIYQVNFTAQDDAGNHTDHALFIVRDPDFRWKEHVLLYLDGVPISGEASPYFWVDTRYKTTDSFSVQVDLEEWGKIDEKFIRPGAHTVTAEWHEMIDDALPWRELVPDSGKNDTKKEDTAIDTLTVTFLVHWASPLGTPAPQYPDPRRPTEGVDQSIAVLDQDGDGIPDRQDLCPGMISLNGDMDGDGIGDECDDDRDGDGVPNGVDNCPWTRNADQRDTDKDGFGDACAPRLDSDKDSIPDAIDNCPFTWNPDQSNIDEDQELQGSYFGDACDADMDGDGVANVFEPECGLRDPNEWLDTDGDGICNGADEDDDNDGYSDAAETKAGTDPLDRTSHPRTPIGGSSPHEVGAAAKGSWWMLFVVIGVILLVAALLAWLVLPRKDE